MATQQQSKTINMRFVSRATLPVIGRGIQASGPSVTVMKNGQIMFNTLASKCLSTSRVIISIDPKSREIYVLGATEANTKKHKITDDLVYPLKTSKKGGTYSFAASSLLNSVEDFGGKLYDYRASDNQTFEAKADEENNMVVFVLPEGSLVPKAKRAMKPRVKKADKLAAAANGVANSGNATGLVNGAPATVHAPNQVQGDGDDLLLNT